MTESILEFCIEHQYELPRRYYVYAETFPHVTFSQAIHLYKLAVEEILVLFKAKHLFDEPLSFGRGLVCARDEWIKKMLRAEKIWKEAEE